MKHISPLLEGFSICFYQMKSDLMHQSNINIKRHWTSREAFLVKSRENPNPIGTLSTPEICSHLVPRNGAEFSIGKLRSRIWQNERWDEGAPRFNEFQKTVQLKTGCKLSRAIPDVEPGVHIVLSSIPICDYICWNIRRCCSPSQPEPSAKNRWFAPLSASSVKGQRLTPRVGV